MHRKFAIVDKETIFIGSTNWTNNGFENNNEIDVCFKDSQIANQIVTRFKEDWEKSSECYPVKSEDPPEVKPEPPKPPEDKPEVKYIGNSNSKKFHHLSCRSVKDIKPEHKVEFYKREEAISQGYEPCKICKP